MRDVPGVLNEVSGVLARRGYNVQSLAVGNSEREGMSRIITVIPGTPEGTANIIKQLYKLIHVEQACCSHASHPWFCLITILQPACRVGHGPVEHTIRVAGTDDGQGALQRIAAAGAERPGGHLSRQRVRCQP